MGRLHRDASWWLKLDRAQRHFQELETLIGLPLDRQPHGVTKQLNSQGEAVWSLNMDVALDVNVPIVAGDVLFNIRSALDHLACALVPAENKRRVQFPMFTDDPFETDPASGNYRHPESYRNSWRAQTAGIPDEALAIIKGLQPYEEARLAGKRPDQAVHHVLSILRALQDADKHRKLIFLRPSVKKARLFIEGVEEAGIVPGLQSGTVFAETLPEVNVQLDGLVSIPFGVANDVGYEYPIMFNLIFEAVADKILPALEPLVPG
jgi:hypothetical protein